MKKGKERRLACAHDHHAPDADPEKKEQGAMTLADLFVQYRREGWSDSEIEMGIGGQ